MSELRSSFSKSSHLNTENAFINSGLVWTSWKMWKERKEERKEYGSENEEGRRVGDGERD